MKVWAFLAKNITLKPASQYLHGTLAVLARYKPSPKVPSVQPEMLLKSCYKIKKYIYLVEFSTE